MTDKPELVRPLTYEQMSPEQRAMYDPRRRRRSQVPQTIHEYDPLVAYDDQIEQPFHRDKR
jgi:hypothetical protein